MQPPFTASGRFLLTCLLRGMTENLDVVSYPFSFLLTCLLRGMTMKSLSLTSVDGFLLTCLLRGMTSYYVFHGSTSGISTHMPLARHDMYDHIGTNGEIKISTHMPLARHDLRRFLHHSAH